MEEKEKEKEKTEIVLDRKFSGSVFLFSEKSYKIVKKSKVEFEIEIEKSFFPFFKNQSLVDFFLFRLAKHFFNRFQKE